MLESRHVSRHYEKRQKQSQHKGKGKWAKAVNRSRSRVVKHLPKLSLAVHASSHLILAARACTGIGSDSPHFVPLMLDAARRMPLEFVLADAGFDSEDNHRLARQELSIRSVIPATIGRQSSPGARRLLPTADAPAIPGRSRQGSLRPALAGRDGQQHDQAKSRIGMPSANTHGEEEGHAAASDHSQRHDCGQSMRVETEQDMTGKPNGEGRSVEFYYDRVFFACQDGDNVRTDSSGASARSRARTISAD